MKSIVLPLMLATASCASTPPTTHATAQSVSAASAPLASYRTFSFGDADPPRAGYEVSAHSLEVQQHLTSLVEAAFVERGYVKSGEGGDLIVKLTSGTAVPAASPGERTPGVPPQGFIGIDVYDRTTGAEVWQGTAFAEIALDKIDDDLLRRGVGRMFATFPQRADATAPRAALE